MIEIKFLARKFLYKNFILQPLFQSAQHFYQKRKGSGAGSPSGSVLVIRMRIWEAQKHTDPDPDADPEHRLLGRTIKGIDRSFELRGESRLI